MSCGAAPGLVFVYVVTVTDFPAYLRTSGKPLLIG